MVDVVFAGWMLLPFFPSVIFPCYVGCKFCTVVAWSPEFVYQEKSRAGSLKIRDGTCHIQRSLKLLKFLYLPTTNLNPLNNYCLYALIYPPVPPRWN